MEFTETEQALKLFGDYVIQQSRSNLTKGKHNVDNKLYESLRYKLEVENDGVVVSFYMEDYGEFQDRGVKGVENI